MIRVPAQADEISNVYIDETSQNKHEYLVLGGLILDKTCMLAFNSLTKKARLPDLERGEMKWGKVSKTKLPAYKRVVDLFFSNDPFCRPMHFHSVVVHTPKLKDKVFNQGSREIGFNKEIYQLCMKFGRLYPGRLFHRLSRRAPNKQPN